MSQGGRGTCHREGPMSQEGRAHIIGRGQCHKEGGANVTDREGHTSWQCGYKTTAHPINSDSKVSI